MQTAAPNYLRDVWIARVEDMQRSFDYLVARADIVEGRLGFFGLSTGAFASVPFTQPPSRHA